MREKKRNLFKETTNESLIPKRKPVERYYHSKEDDKQQFLSIILSGSLYKGVSYN